MTFWVGGFLAQWATAKLHRFTVICFFSLFLSSFWFLFFLSLFFIVFGSIPPICWLPFPVAASDLSAPKKCRARFGLDQQNNWCGPCRCVWCVLALARARWRLGNWTLGLPPLSAAAPPFFSLFFPPPCLFRQAIMTSQLPPATPCRSISRFPLFDFYLLFGKKGINSICQSVCMNDDCVCVLIKNTFLGLQGFHCRMNCTKSLTEMGQKS